MVRSQRRLCGHLGKTSSWREWYRARALVIKGRLESSHKRKVGSEEAGGGMAGGEGFQGRGIIACTGHEDKTKHEHTGRIVREA